MNIFEEQKKYEEAIKIMNQDPCKDICWHMTQDILQQKNSAMAMEFTKIICGMMKDNGVSVKCSEISPSVEVVKGMLEEKYRFCIEELDFSVHDKKFKDEIKKLKEELQCNRTVISQIDEIFRELFNATFEICETKEDFDGFKKYLKKNIGAENISDFLPTEPIKVASMLIDNYMGTYEKYVSDFYQENAGKIICGDPCEDVHCQIISHIRQIAEHLLVYCNARDGKHE